MKSYLRLPLLIRGYATRLPQKPPMRHPDPLLNNPNAVTTSLPEDLTFIHRSPPSASTPFSYTSNPTSPLLLAESPPAAASFSLPPRVLRPKSPPNQLSEEQIKEMRRLRAEDPTRYTRSKLSKMFGCSIAFVGFMAPLDLPRHKEALERLNQIHEKMRALWGEKAALIHDIRKKRKKYW
ncbi:mitochondrial ribosomal protein subunit L20-domain-containing protein [Lactarius vividus]|nr:mitochondrial ribosomal protein subunit L20-domain-containing protein [Lactarius vividus]